MNLDKNIGWCTHTHNIATGCLNQKLGLCDVAACYARQTAENPFYRKAFPYGFEPHFYWERLDQVAKLRKPAIIFMDSMSDTFGSWWPENQVRQILNVMDSMRGVHWHKYVDLTKNPKRLVDILLYTELPGDQGFRYPAENFQNVYFGTSVSGNNVPIEINRIKELHYLKIAGFKTVLSVEPLIHNPVDMIANAGGIDWFDWIIIGGQTKPTKLPEPSWIFRLIDAVSPKPIYMKENCGVHGAARIVQFPADLLPIAQVWGKV